MDESRRVGPASFKLGHLRFISSERYEEVSYMIPLPERTQPWLADPSLVETSLKLPPQPAPPAAPLVIPGSSLGLDLETSAQPTNYGG